MGEKIVCTLDDSVTIKEGMNTTTIIIHIVERKNRTKYIGIELRDNAKLAWSMRPITLNKQQAKQLDSMLGEAISRA